MHKIRCGAASKNKAIAADFHFSEYDIGVA